MLRETIYVLGWKGKEIEEILKKYKESHGIDYTIKKEAPFGKYSFLFRGPDGLPREFRNRRLRIEVTGEYEGISNMEKNLREIAKLYHPPSREYSNMVYKEIKERFKREHQSKS